LDQDVSERHDVAQNGILIRIVRDATVQSDTWRYQGAALLIRWPMIGMDIRKQVADKGCGSTDREPDL